MLDKGATHAGQCEIASCGFQLKTRIFYLILSGPCLLWVTEMAKSKTADKGDSYTVHPRAVFWKRLYYTLILK